MIHIITRSSGEYRRALIGNSDFASARSFEPDESMQHFSVSVGFPTAESLSDIVEMDPQMIRRRVTFSVDDHNDSEEPTDHRQMKEELTDLLDAQQSGTACLHSYSVRMWKEASVLKRLAINFAYHFLRRNCRGPDVVLKVPRASLLEVGKVYVV
ncbi:putative potassium transporter [Helianthus annuus]|nr:putative potassium transporter [Helianthus annuus]